MSEFRNRQLLAAGCAGLKIAVIWNALLYLLDAISTLLLSEYATRFVVCEGLYSKYLKINSEWAQSSLKSESMEYCHLDIFPDKHSNWLHV